MISKSAVLDRPISPAVENVNGQIDESIKTLSKEALEFLDESNRKIYFPKKYFAAQESFLRREAYTLFQTDPALPLMDVVRRIFVGLPDFLPADNIVEVTRIITSEWESLRKEAGYES